MTPSKHQVQLFLKEFKVAAGKQPDQNPARPGVAGKGSGIRYEARAKNWDTLVDLNMTTSMRNDCVLGLAWRDYSQGPMDDDRGNPGDVWVFGINEGMIPIYIKLKLAGSGRIPVCISFHRAEYPMECPFRRFE